MTESKTELLMWLNDLLQLHYVKIEQCGSGKAAES
jgi:RP/EB family microtubule-associated protein